MSCVLYEVYPCIAKRLLNSYRQPVGFARMAVKRVIDSLSVLPEWLSNVLSAGCRKFVSDFVLQKFFFKAISIDKIIFSE